METTPPRQTRGVDPGARTSPCAADPLLRALWGQWKTHVIHALGKHGACRFGVLRRALGTVSPKVLTQRLRELEADGLVWRQHEPTIPPAVTYGLTPFGRQVHGVLSRFDALADAWERPKGADADGGKTDGGDADHAPATARGTRGT